ncbi:TlpA disulfide reductase family protein [Pedobacter metabolipauper]|uniref:Thiol-disulfide isomerase/thioredoxin n=1 Tax=Pedobacter metabolipauper TaxID=425513 RepID=A0A4R6SWN5_9SPHI|nr:TlpA disulfide reductase family protein [Pedobacter metabolipauper]TDQ10260.1 thiol-disulfide isomerase/thioredoxin [Pedobacter metabolipauper]
MNFKPIIILGLSIIPLASFSQSENFAIAGNINRKYDGKFIKLYYNQAQVKKVDSTLVKNGAFKLAGNITAPTSAKLSMGNEDNGDRIDLFLSEGTVRVSAKDSIHYANISGTKLAEEHEQLAKQLRPAEDQLFGSINTFKNMPEGEEKKAYITKFLAGLEEYTLLKRGIIHQFVTKYPSSYISLYYLDKNAPGSLLNYEATYPFYAKLSPELKATVLGKQLEARLLAVKGKMTGLAYKDFISTTPDGKELSLKEVISKNKYTLVDFWASWCGPCRKENPNVVKAFNAFKDKGFTILSVSLDEDAAKWKAAIEKDGMPWYHVSSLKGWKEPAAVLYEIRAIPQNVLVDGQGKVVATNLRAETLFNKIKELTQ